MYSSSDAIFEAGLKDGQPFLCAHGLQPYRANPPHTFWENPRRLATRWNRRSQPADEEFALVDHLGRQMIVEVDEELFVADDLSAPELAVDGLQLLKLLTREFEAFPMDVFVVRSPADGGLVAECAAMGAIDNPFENAHVLAETGPEEVALRSLRNQFTWKTRGVTVSLRCILIQWRK